MVKVMVLVMVWKCYEVFRIALCLQIQIDGALLTDTDTNGRKRVVSCPTR